jgi:hypothetical protein
VRDREVLKKLDKKFKIENIFKLKSFILLIENEKEDGEETTE